MFCTQCGKKISPGNNFCENCGAKVLEVKDEEKQPNLNEISHKSRKKDKKSIIITLFILSAIVVLFLGGFFLFQKISVDREIKKFETNVKNIEKTFKELSLGDYEEEYEALIIECKEIVSSKKVDKIQGIMDKFLALKNKILDNANNKEEIDDDYDYDDEEEYIEEEELDEIINPTTVSSSDIENLVRTFLVNFPDAVNEGEFSIISPYLYPGSNLYNDQKRMIDIWFQQGIEEEFIKFTPKEVTFSEDKSEGTIISEEVFEIYNPDSGLRTETFTWLYKFKYNTDIGEYQLTGISKP